MRLAAFCIKHKVMTVLAFLMIAIFGVVFYSNLKLSLLPNLEFPAAYIMCTFPGASPEDVEELVVRPLESSVATLTGVKEIQSSSSENVGLVMITYEDGTDVDQAAIKLREKFDLLTLPSGCNDPIIVNINIDDLMPVAVIALSGEDLVQLQTVADDVISPSLERLDGVAQVQVMGGIQQQITVETNPTALSGYGLSLSQVSDYLAAANLLYPGGEVYNGTNTLTATTNGKYRTVEDVANTLLFLPQGGTVRLSEVASVYLESSLEDSAAKVDGENCVVLLVNKRAGTNEVDVSRKISSNLEQVRKENPSIQAEVVYQASEYIEQTVNNALQNIGLGVILSAVVVFVFLRRFGATMTISVSMPFCVLTMFLLMNVFDISMNMMSLGAIALCIGGFPGPGRRYGGGQLHRGAGEHLSLRRRRLHQAGKLHPGHRGGHQFHHRLLPDHHRRLSAHRPVRRHDGDALQGLLPHRHLPDPLLPPHRPDPGASAVLLPAG